MKKLSTQAPLIREAEEKNLAIQQENWREYFGAKLSKFNAKSLADMSEEKKSEFFNDLNKDWDLGQGATDAGKKDIKLIVMEGVSLELYEGSSDSPQELASFLDKNQGHFAAFLKPKKLTVSVSGKTVEVKPASGSFTITVDFDKSTIDSTGKPARPESTSYVEILEYIKGVTKFKVLNEGNEINEAKVKTDAEFKEYAETVLKKAFGEEYDQKKADETINGILKKVGGDYGAAIGMLTSGLSESKFVKEDGYEEFAEIDENLSLSNLGVEGDVLYVMINGNKYGYKAPAGKDIEDLAKSFAGLAKHSAGKALAWIKKNAELVFGSKKVQESVNEGEEIFISDERFQDLGSLKADILKKITPAINDFLARQGIKYNPITIKEDRGRYTFISKPVTGKDLGFFQYGMVEAYIDSFGGGQVPRIREADGKIEFNPLIWFNLHYSYKHGSTDTGPQGSNGCALYPPGEDTSNIWYNISTGRFLTNSEAEKTKF